MKKIAVLGEGAFGTAMACLIADCGSDVTLWCHDASVVHQIHEVRVNQRYMPGVCLIERVYPTDSLSHAVAQADIIFVSTPVKFLRSILQKAAPFYNEQQIWVFLCKGIEQESLMLPTQIADDVLGDMCNKAVVMGPSFARELISKQPTQVVIASDSQNIADQLQQLLQTSYFKASVSDDILGVQISAAYKNVIALGAGMLHGAGYGENIRAVLLTKGLHEMALLVETIGGTAETVASVAGMGDLVLTAYSTQSRNFIIGKRLGHGERLDTILHEMDAIPEGVTTAQALAMLSDEAEISLPISTAIYAFMTGSYTIESFIEVVMNF